MTKQVPIFSN